MPLYLIERNVPGAHRLTASEQREGATRSCDVLDRLGPDIEWRQSFVTEDRITCVYNARNEEVVREHARLSGFPADAIHEIAFEMGPATAEPRTAAR